MKYEALFLLLTFQSLWRFEVLARRRVHSLQYLLVGAAICSPKEPAAVFRGLCQLPPMC